VNGNAWERKTPPDETGGAFFLKRRSEENDQAPMAAA